MVLKLLPTVVAKPNDIKKKRSRSYKSFMFVFCFPL